MGSGPLLLSWQSDRYYDDMVNLAKSHGVYIANLIATDDRTVASIVDAGFDWVYESLHTTNALSTCHQNCNSATAPFAVGQAHRTLKKL